ncbi:MAG: aldehyde ferredoxin oxidoreductase family protein [Peptococcaceae bacterium]|nr:aldehyde ferredoxin oxidoreductase family protein [Peptococcaceae bacterium]
MYGYIGKVLIVNLSDYTHEVRDLDPEWARYFIGGATLGARYLYELMPPKTHVFAPESVIGFVSGPLNNTKALLSARSTVVCKSPATGCWNDSSCGGTFGPNLRKSGYDAIFIKGKADKPIYLFVDNGKVEFRDASHLWGKTTMETTEAIKAEVGKDAGIAVIGPGGEHLSYMAAIINEHRAFGRGGSGAVMGSKNLKAVACRGNAKVLVKDEDALVACNKECIAYGSEGGRGEAIVAQFKTTGTSAEYDSCVMMADAPIKNFAGIPEIDITEEQARALTGMEMDPKFKIGKDGCNNCYIKCGAKYKLNRGKYKTDHATRPEYESLGAFGSMLLNGDAETAIILNYLCNQYGYDTISFGGTISWLMECYEKGIVTREELDGIDLKWGDPEAIVAIAEKICNYEGIGIPLNLASRGAARALGKGSECLVTASGMEIPMHGARFNPGLARIFQYDPSPGRHIKGGRGVPYGHKPPEVKYNYENTGKEDAEGLLEWELTDSCGICGFGNFLLPPWIAKKMVNAITGFNFTDDDWVLFSYRSFTLRHSFNLREGLRRKDFTIDGRAVGKPPLEAGPLKGITVDNEKLADNFYSYLGWDLETAIPPKEFYEKMGGLDFIIKDLYPEKAS